MSDERESVERAPATLLPPVFARPAAPASPAVGGGSGAPLRPVYSADPGSTPDPVAGTVVGLAVDDPGALPETTPSAVAEDPGDSAGVAPVETTPEVGGDESGVFADAARDAAPDDLPWLVSPGELDGGDDGAHGGEDGIPLAGDVEPGFAAGAAEIDVARDGVGEADDATSLSGALEIAFGDEPAGPAEVELVAGFESHDAGFAADAAEPAVPAPVEGFTSFDMDVDAGVDGEPGESLEPDGSLALDPGFGEMPPHGAGSPGFGAADLVVPIVDNTIAGAEGPADAIGSEAGATPEDGDAPAEDLAARLERLARVLRERGADAVHERLQSPDRLEALLAGVLAGYLAARQPEGD